MKDECAKPILPPLHADEALRLVHILETIIAAVWQAHGHDMSERLIDHHTQPEIQPDPFTDSSEYNLSDIEHLLF